MRHVFDLDGTLIDSARMKTEAFRSAGRVRYGVDAGNALAAIHVASGSVGRRQRVERFFAEHLGLPEVGEAEIHALLDEIAERLAVGYVSAALVPGAVEYLAMLGGRAIIVSGIEQRELERILHTSGLARYVALAYGGDKHVVLRRLVADGVIWLPARYYGDTPDDASAALAAGLDFTLIHGCSEWRDWRDHAAPSGRFTAVPDFTALQGAVV